MKKFQALFFSVVFGGLLCSLTGPAFAQTTADSGFATVVRVEGVASYSLGDDKWIPLVAGKILPEGAIIRTGHNGVVDAVLGKDINLPQNAQQIAPTPSFPALAPDAPVRGLMSYQPSVEQNVVRLTPDTTLGISKLTVTDTGADTVSDTELDLKQGKIFASVKKLSGSSQYLIKLPSGIAGVRGTQFSIDVNGSVSVYHSTGGGVVLSLISAGGAPQTTVVGAGFSYDPATGLLTILSGDEATFLKRLFTALVMVYSPVAFVCLDNTQIYVSPVHGGHGGHHHHHGGGGQGGNQGP
jgi:hypothetical protein